jgi:hypothetical protein
MDSSMLRELTLARIPSFLNKRNVVYCWAS